MASNILILGFDDFCGWPTALHLSNQGYNIIGVSNIRIDNIIWYLQKE